MPRKLVRRRIRRQFPRILYFSEVYDSSYGDPTGEEEWLAKLYGGRNYAVGKGDKFKWQGRVPRHPPARFIIVSIPCHTLTQFEEKKKKKKKRGAEKCTPWRLCRTTWLVIRRFISGRVRSERDGLIAFRISLTSFTNSRLLLVCGHGKKWKIELVPGVRRRWARRWIFSNASFDATFSFNWPVWWRWKYSSRNDVFKILVDDIATFLPSYI